MVLVSVPTFKLFLRRCLLMQFWPDNLLKLSCITEVLDASSLTYHPGFLKTAIFAP
jgi:hypothetical protein